MWVEAILARGDLDSVLHDFCPLSIRLGDSGSLALLLPRDVVLVPGVGLRVTVGLELDWPVLGFQVPVSIESATLEVIPEIRKAPAGDQLAFRLRLEDVDISILPAFVDRTIVARVNQELEERQVELSWGFTDTLTHLFDLPYALASARALDLRAMWGGVRVTDEALVLVVSFEARVEPGKIASPPPAALVHAPRRPGVKQAASRAIARSSPRTMALVGAGCLLAGLGLGALSASRRRPRPVADFLRGLVA